MPSPVIGSVTAAASPTNSDPPGGERDVVDAGGDRPGPVRCLGLGVGAEHVGDARAGQQLGPERPCPGSSPWRPAGCRTRRWPGRRAAGTTRRSRAAGRARTTPTARARPAGPTSGSTGGRRATRRGSRGPRCRAACAPATTCRRRRRRTGAVSVEPSSRVSVDASAPSSAPVTAVPSSTSTPASRATSSSAASRSVRRATAAYVPGPRGSGKVGARSRTGELTTTSSTCCHDATVFGSRPSSSSSRRAPVVRPSPQILSRGNVALSTTVTDAPGARAG